MIYLRISVIDHTIINQQHKSMHMDCKIWIMHILFSSQ